MTHSLFRFETDDQPGICTTNMPDVTQVSPKSVGETSHLEAPEIHSSRGNGQFGVGFRRGNPSTIGDDDFDFSKRPFWLG